MSDLIRTFISVNLPENISDELEGFISSRLKPLSKIRFVTREQFHMTLKFLGEISPEKIELVKKSLSQIKFDPFEINLTNVGAFPNIKNPRVLWISGEKGVKELQELAGNIDEKIFNIAGLPREEKKFKAHLTLARLKNPELLNNDVLKALEEISNLKMQWECSEINLMKSVLTPQGAIYSKIF